MTFSFEQPPDKLTWYHLGPLLDAEAGALKYNPDQYTVHGVSNNAVACCWAGLLVDADGGLVLTDLGRGMLADWKASPTGQQWLAGQADLGEEPDSPTVRSLPAPQPVPQRADQLGLFGAAS
ncbi:MULTISPECIES: hypothetical protein [unclassified Streptomyces]|uniref:hypothetical protein n=1 Tax=unclassified Streptomyces TaxID=2593676 RepID=UPI002E297BC0|nr:hypothetical protein [Streptomyces sp. NBC_00334]